MAPVLQDFHQMLTRLIIFRPAYIFNHKDNYIPNQVHRMHGIFHGLFKKSGIFAHTICNQTNK